MVIKLLSYLLCLIAVCEFNFKFGFMYFNVRGRTRLQAGRAVRERLHLKFATLIDGAMTIQ